MPATGWTTSSSRSSVSPLPPSPPARSPRRLRSRNVGHGGPGGLRRRRRRDPAGCPADRPAVGHGRPAWCPAWCPAGSCSCSGLRRPWRPGPLSCLVRSPACAGVAGGAAALATLLALPLAGLGRCAAFGRGLGRVLGGRGAAVGGVVVPAPVSVPLRASEELLLGSPRRSRMAAMSSLLRIPEAPLTPTSLASARSSGSTMVDREPDGGVLRYFCRRCWVRGRRGDWHVRGRRR